MRDDLEQRAKELALYMIENRTTVRAAAKGLLHKNNAAHKKSALTLKLNKIG